jgi:hypothetical protein
MAKSRISVRTGIMRHDTGHQAAGSDREGTRHLPQAVPPDQPDGQASPRPAASSDGAAAKMAPRGSHRRGDGRPPADPFLDHSHCTLTTARSGTPHSMLDKPAVAVITPIV